MADLDNELPSDSELAEQMISARIVQLLLQVPLIADEIVNVYVEERYPDSDEEDKVISTVPDPVTGQPVTSIIMLGIPSVEELAYTGDTCTQLNFTYPMSFERTVRDKWEKDDFIYTSSAQLVKGVYMKARKKLKMDDNGDSNRTLGFKRCVHNFLQQDSVVTVEDEESGGLLHVCDWSLSVQVTGVIF